MLSDVTGDGIPDYLVGAYDQPYAREGMTGMELGVGGSKKTGKNVDHQGRAFVYDGQTAKLLYLIDHPFPQKAVAFACTVASAGDVNQDGGPDLLIGAFGQNQSGLAYVYGRADGQLLLTLDSPDPKEGSTFGWRVIAAGDLNKDEVPDLLVGAQFQSVDEFHIQGEVFL